MELSELSAYNIALIDCNKIFAEKISDNIVDDLEFYNLLDYGVTREVKRLFYHHVMFTLCEEILKSKSKGKHILFFNNTQLLECSILSYLPENIVIVLLSSIIQKIGKVLPVRSYISRYSADYFSFLLKEGDGKGRLLLNELRKESMVDSFNYSFNTINKFTYKYGLSWLNNEYFNRISTKLLLIK